MGDMLAFLETADEVRPSDRALARPSKALQRVKEQFSKLPDDLRTPETFLCSAISAGVSEATAQKVVAFAWQMFGRRETTKPVATKEKRS